MTRTELQEKVKLLPSAPGIYMMKNKDGKIIYVGKSKSLHNRVSHYFQPLSSLNPKTAKLSVNIDDFECIYTKSEAEALILENELIKRHSPKYNIKLKDAKSYPYVKISYRGEYPGIMFSRNRLDDKAKYFGPYVSSKSVNEIIDTVCKTFRVDSCGKSFRFGKKVSRPCLSYHMGQCIAPCTGEISVNEYREIFSEIEEFLGGDYKKVINNLESKMLAASENLEFENAAKYRDRISSIKKLSEHQSIISNPDKEIDVFGLHLGETSNAISVIFIRNGKVIDKEDYVFSVSELCDEYELCDFIERFYGNCGHIPATILLSFELSQENISELSLRLAMVAGRKVNISIPVRGEKRVYAQMASRNAGEAVRQKAEMLKRDEEVLVALAALLRLNVVPERIEAYDISNNGKDDIYAGMIVLENGKFKKSDYRAFSIKQQGQKQDDYSAMYEALKRRMIHLMNSEEKSSFSIRPDLILLDGGVGHVNTIKKLFSELKIDIAVIGMVKDDFHKTRTLTDGVAEISISKNMSIFSFIYGIQEEVHRYTFSLMDGSRNKKIKHSVLEDIPGVGKARATALIKRFKSIQNIKKASADELVVIAGISESLAYDILEYLNGGGKNNEDYNR